MRLLPTLVLWIGNVLVVPSACDSKHDGLHGFFAAKGPDAQVCVEIGLIKAKGGQITGSLTETHVVGEKQSDIARYTIHGVVSLGSALPAWGSNGTANFSSTSVSLGLVTPDARLESVKGIVNPLGSDGGQSRACQYTLSWDLRSLVLKCNPPSSSKFEFMGYDKHEKSDSFPNDKVPWKSAANLVRHPSDCHHIAIPPYKDPRFLAVPRPTVSTHVLRLTLDGSIEKMTASKKSELESAVAKIGGLPASKVSLRYIMGGSIIVQFNIEATKKAAELYTKWVDTVDRGTVRLCGFQVLAASFFYHQALKFTMTADKVPGWAAAMMIVSAMVFLCWVAYTVQCRHMVLELERSEQSADTVKYPYQRLGRNNATPDHGRHSIDAR